MRAKSRRALSGSQDLGWGDTRNPLHYPLGGDHRANKSEIMTVKFTTEPDLEALDTLFKATFTDSEGESEGQLIGHLVHRIATQTAQEDLRLYGLESDAKLIGGVIFTRLRYAQDPRTVFLLSPMAIATPEQGLGYGQRLIREALARLALESVEVVLTYGDIRFYQRAGFRQVTLEEAAAPMALSVEAGWLGQWIGKDSSPLKGPATCVAAFEDPRLW